MPRQKGKLDPAQLRKQEALDIDESIRSLLLHYRKEDGKFVLERPPLSTRQIADKLGCSPATAHTHLYRLLKQGVVIKVHKEGQAFDQWAIPAKPRAVRVGAEFEAQIARRKQEIEFRERLRKFLSPKEFEKRYPNPRKSVHPK